MADCVLMSALFPSLTFIFSACLAGARVTASPLKREAQDPLENWQARGKIPRGIHHDAISSGGLERPPGHAG